LSLGYQSWDTRNQKVSFLALIVFTIKYFTFVPYSKVSGGDQMSPLSLYPTMSELKRSVQEIVEKHLLDENHFIVDVNLSEKSGKTLLGILIDSDAGVTIQACAKLSRAVSEELEAKEMMPEAYVLEVSSPGIDYPLSSKRQFQKNINRELKITLESGEEVTGKLLEVGNNGVKLSVKKKEKGKKAAEEEIEVPFEKMKKSIVQVSFK
jgi:ribosome maturation factor RimP